MLKCKQQVLLIWEGTLNYKLVFICGFAFTYLLQYIGSVAVV